MDTARAATSPPLPEGRDLTGVVLDLDGGMGVAGPAPVSRGQASTQRCESASGGVPPEPSFADTGTLVRQLTRRRIDPKESPTVNAALRSFLGLAGVERVWARSQLTDEGQRRSPTVSCRRCAGRRGRHHG